MEEPTSEMEKSIDITAEHAVLIPLIPSVKAIMAYVEAVAVVIGSCHIHSVYEDQDYIKVYLNDTRFVDVLVNNGVTVLGRRMNVDYAFPRGDKVILTNVDPIVPDSVLMKLLQFYGSPMTEIIHEKIATNSEYSHIECGKRKVYMKLLDNKNMPNKISFTYQDVYYQVDVLVEQSEGNVVCESSFGRGDERSEGEDEEDVIEVESTKSMKPNINELFPIKQPTPKQMAYRNRGRPPTNKFSAGAAARQIKRRARKGWYSSRIRKQNTNQVIKPVRGRAKRLVVQKYLAATAKRGKGKTAKDSSSKPASRKSSAPNSVQDGFIESNDGIEMNVDPSSFLENNYNTDPLSTVPGDALPVSQNPLSTDELDKFIFKTRFHRDPMQVAMEFLSDAKSPEALSALKTQLLEYHNVCKENSLKIRIKRLVTSLKNSKVNDNSE